MDFKDLILKRRACKLFNDKKINEADLRFILESGILAPSSYGFEPWKFVVLNEKEDNLKLAICVLINKMSQVQVIISFF